MPRETKSPARPTTLAVDRVVNLPTFCDFAPWREKSRFLFAIFAFSAVNSRHPESAKGLL